MNAFIVTYRSLFLLFCSSLFIFISSSATKGSEPSTAVLALTLARAQELALVHNSSLLHLGYETARREVEVREARRARRPDLDLDIELAERFGRSFDRSIGRLEDRRSTALGLRAQSTIKLFDRQGHAAAVFIAEREWAAGKERSHRARQRVLFEVSSRYMVILLDAVLIQIEREHVAAQREQLRRIEGFWRLGKRPHSDVLQQRAALARAQLRLLASERQLATDKLNLKDVLGIEPQIEIELVDSGTRRARPTLPTYDLASLLDDALVTRPDIKALMRGLEASAEAVRRARIHYWPQVDLSVGVGTDYTSLDDDLGLVDQLLEASPNAVVGLSFSTPILDRGLAKGVLQRAQIAHREAALQLADQRRAVSLALQQALLDYDVAQQQLVVAREERAYAQEALKEITTRYDGGMATVSELTQARAQHVEAAGGEAVARHSVSLRELTIDFIANRLSDSPISQVEEAH